MTDEDPYDDVTSWVGNLPVQGTDSTKHTDKRPTRGGKSSDVQRKAVPEEERRQDKPSLRS